MKKNANKKMPLGMSICVVLYRAEEETILFHERLLESLQDYSDFELLYYDNSPTDSLREDLSRHPTSITFSYLHDGRNFGFSYANNQLILKSKYERILLLNPDVYGFDANTWSLIGGHAVNNKVIFAKLLNQDGSFQDCIGEVVSIRRALSNRKDYGAIIEKTKIGMGIMAFMLTGKNVFAHVGLLDTDYPLYAEDMDWCYRATKSGYDLIYDPSIVLTHTGGASAKNRWSNGATLRKKFSAERIFVNKHYNGFNWFFLRVFNFLKVIRSYFYG